MPSLVLEGQLAYNLHIKLFRKCGKTYQGIEFKT